MPVENDDTGKRWLEMNDGPRLHLSHYGDDVGQLAAASESRWRDWFGATFT